MSPIRFSPARRFAPLAAALAVTLIPFTLAAVAAGHPHPATPAAKDDAASAPVDLASCTGVLIDARHLSDISRSPAPFLYGPEPESSTVYPDPKHVPTPDEVQDESVVRYYQSEESARKGYIGDKPLIVRAVAVVGPGKDCLRLAAEDVEKLKELDNKIHFTHTWKVGVLLPDGK